MSRMTLLTLIPVLALAAPANAEGPGRAGRSVGRVDKRVVLAEEVDDLFAFGEEVAIQAPVHDNAFVIARHLTIEHEVGGDVYGMGQTLTIDRPVHGDVYALGSVVTVGTDGVIHGDLYVGAEALVVEGRVLGGIDGGVGRAALRGEVGGDVTLEAGEVAVGPNAQIGGDLIVEGPRPPDVPESATVEGSKQHIEALPPEETPKPEPGLVRRLLGWAFGVAWAWSSGLAVGFALLFLGGAAVQRTSRQILDAPASAAGLGFLTAIVLPIASVMAMALIVPLPLGILGLLSWGVGLYVARLLAAQALGDAVLGALRPGAVGSPYVSMAVGLGMVVLGMKLPFIGCLVWIVATVLGLGAIYRALREARVH